MKPIIRYDGDSPIALCNRCFIVMCSVSSDDEDSARVVTSKLDYEGHLCTSAKKGSRVPIYCDKCKKLLTYSLNE